MSGRLAGKKIFITGGAQGLGAAMAKGVASEGAKVTVTDINKDGAEKVAAEINAAHGAGPRSGTAMTSPTKSNGSQRSNARTPTWAAFPDW
jgi:NAD(P)-dependent dehydrogenase (short-subunit alcohol dehydrogenase family)